jgi:hypothetical protein
VSVWSHVLCTLAAGQPASCTTSVRRLLSATPPNGSTQRHIPEQHKELVCVSRIQLDGVARLNRPALEAEPVIGHGGRPCQLTGACEAQHQQVQDETIVLCGWVTKTQGGMDRGHVRTAAIMMFFVTEGRTP